MAGLHLIRLCKISGVSAAVSISVFLSGLCRSVCEIQSFHDLFRFLKGNPQHKMTVNAYVLTTLNAELNRESFNVLVESFF